MKFLLNDDSVWRRAALRPLIAFNYVDLIPITQSEFEVMPIFQEGEQIGVVADYERAPVVGEDMGAFYRGQFKYKYGYTLARDHRKLVGIFEAIRISNAAGIRAIIYITPIDYQSAELYAGADLLARLRSHVKVVQEVLASEGGEDLDISEAIGPEAFCYDYAVHEHLDQGVVIS